MIHIPLAIMASNLSNSQQADPSAHRDKTCTKTANKSNSNQASITPKRFPDYILAGSLNLHKSPVNAAALITHIATQWDYLRINRTGIISSKQLEINRNPESYGGLRNGKPLTVSEWNKAQKDKLVEQRKKLAEAEALVPGADVNDTSKSKGVKSSRSPSRGRGRSRGRSRGQGRGKLTSNSDRCQADANGTGGDQSLRPSSNSRARGRARGQTRGHSRGGVFQRAVRLMPVARPAATLWLLRQLASLLPRN